MKKLRIAILKNTLQGGGGLEKYCTRLTRALQEEGHSVTILTTSPTQELPSVQVCKRLKMSALNLVWFDIHCRRWLRKNSQDIVFGFDRHFLPLTHYRAGNGCHAAYLARRKKESSFWKRIFLCFNPFHWLTLLSEHMTFEHHSEAIIICNSHLVKQEILHYYPRASQEKLIVIHNGVEWNEYADPFQQKLSVPKSLSSPPHLLFIGHEWKRKGVDRLLEALSFLRDENFILTVVGREKDPEYFFKLAKKFRVHDKIRFYPMGQNPLPFYQTSQIAVLPSRYDPFANVTLEALAMGLYVITTTSNGGSEAIINHLNGVIVDEYAPTYVLADAIRAAFSVATDSSRPEIVRNSVKHYDFFLKLRQITSLLEEFEKKDM